MNAKQLPDFDVANYLTDAESIQAFLAPAAEEQVTQIWAHALDDVARARARWGLHTLPPGA